MTISPMTLTALNRFGLGARFDLAEAVRIAIETDPRGYLKSQLMPESALLNTPDLDSSRVNLLINFAEQERKKMEREAMAAANNAAATLTSVGATAPAGAMSPTAMSLPVTAQTARQGPAQGLMGPPAPRQNNQAVQHEIMLAEATARWRKGFEDTTGLVERLVWFWSNHFAVSVAKDQAVEATVGAYEREAIRPFVLGKFGDMLKAVEQHPIMLTFLDNRNSIGPDSRAGQKQKKGLNENLAREILELHTLGVDGGYSQADVTNFARVITGWTWTNPNNPNFEPATFVFNPNTHEPGEPLVLGKIYGQQGIAQGEAVLNDLAQHPSTAKHLATKFVRHFVADEPPAALVAKLTKVYLDTGGDLMTFTKALIDDDAAWTTPATKLRTPQEFVMAAARAINYTPPPDTPERILYAINDLGQPLWRPSGPNGFGDRVQDWASAEGMKMRFAWASNMASQANVQGNPTDVANIVFADAASPETRQTIARAESRNQGFALLLMSPEFQRR
ncbi:MAG: DUF1800 family protein [Pseudomonadota bacterium]|nr:DUF1800 family protein [Pseudomonadota bacterium]